MVVIFFEQLFLNSKSGRVVWMGVWDGWRRIGERAKIFSVKKNRDCIGIFGQ